MPALIMDRRKFLTGLSALIVAPAIVRATNLMPVKNFYYDRFMYDYLIGTDQLAIRMDRATFPLRIPTYGPKVLTLSELHQVVPKEVIQKFLNLKIYNNEQKYSHFVLRDHLSSDHGVFI